MNLIIPSYLSDIGEQVGIRWTLARDPLCVDIVKTEYLTGNINNWTVDGIAIPEGTVLYLVYKREIQYTDGRKEFLPESAPIPVFAVTNDSVYIASQEGVIDEPLLTVNTVEINDDEVDAFHVRSTRFRGNIEGHAKSHWLLTSEDGSILHKSLYDSLNKEEFTVPKSVLANIDYNNSSYMEVHCYHVTPSGIISPKGSLKISLAWTNYRVSGLFKETIPGIDFTFDIEKINPQLPLDIYKICLVHTISKEEIYSVGVTSDIDHFTIPGVLLEAGSSYTVAIYSDRYNNSEVVKKFGLSTQAANIVETLDIGYEYENKLGLIKTDPFLLNMIDGITSFETSTGLIPMVLKNSNELKTYRYNRENKQLVDLNTKFGGVMLPTTNNDGIALIRVSPSIIVIDTYNVDGVPAFYIYKYSPYHNLMTQLAVIPREDETTPVGVNNSYLVVSPERLVYIPTNSSNVKELWLDSFEVKVFSSLKDTSVIENMMIPVTGNSVLILGGDIKSRLLHLDNKIETDANIIPAMFNNRRLKSIGLRNGDSIIWRINPVSGDTDLDNQILRFDYKRSTLDKLTPEYTGISYPNVAIKLATGDILLIETNSTSARLFSFK